MILPKSNESQKPPIRPKTSVPLSLAPISDGCPHRSIGMPQQRCVPHAIVWQGDNPYQAWPPHLAQSYPSLNEHTVGYGPVWKNGIPEHLLPGIVNLLILRKKRLLRGRIVPHHREFPGCLKMGQRLTNDLRFQICSLDLPRRPRHHLIPLEQTASNETFDGGRTDPTIPGRLLQREDFGIRARATVTVDDIATPGRPHTVRGPAIAFARATPMFVQHPRNLLIAIAHRHLADQLDGFGRGLLRYAPLGLGHVKARVAAALPVHHKPQPLSRDVLVDNDFSDHRTDDRLTQLHRTMRTVPHFSEPLPKTQNRRTVAVRQGPLVLRQRGQGRLHRRDQAMPRIDLVILFKGALRFIMELFKLMLEGLALLVLTLLQTLKCLQA